MKIDSTDTSLPHRFTEEGIQGQARNGDGQPISPASCVIPILKVVGELQLKVVGTGFYLTRYGVFATAKHVLDEFVDWGSHTLQPGCVLQDDPFGQLLIHRIVGISASNTADVAIAQADNGRGEFVQSNLRCPLSLTRPAVGENLVTYAYPENALLDFRDGLRPPTLRGIYLRGVFRAQVDSGSRPFIPYPHYETSLEIRSGASGCPIFANSRIVGIACRGWDFRGSDHEGDELSSVLPLTQLLPLELACIRIPANSWEYSQVPACRRSSVLTFAELVTYGHVDVGAL